MNPAGSTVYLEDYAPPPFLIPLVELDIELLSAEQARVTARLAIRRNPAAPQAARDLALDLDEVRVESVAVDDRMLRTICGRSEPSRSRRSATTPLICAAATEVPVVSW